MSGALLTASPAASFGALAVRLRARAEAIGKAALVARVLAARADPRRWRRADLVWPAATWPGSGS